jgi:hypothetical protein
MIKAFKSVNSLSLSLQYTILKNPSLLCLPRQSLGKTLALPRLIPSRLAVSLIVPVGPDLTYHITSTKITVIAVISNIPP